MIIHRKRIRNIEPYIRHIKNGSKIVVGISSPERFLEKLKQIGFSEPLQASEAILPAAIFGSISTYNAEGKEVIHKDQPMETAYRQAEWHWEEWDGPYDRIPRSKIVDIPYQRYPRTFLPPIAAEFTIVKKTAGELLVIGPVIENSENNKEFLTHLVNLFLEIFGECQFFSEDLESSLQAPVTRVNWEIFPQGEVPWAKLERHLDPLIKKAPEGKQPVILHRLEIINVMSPNFIAVGRGGFHGYIVHGFSDKNLFILESMYYGNATYVFDESWEELSKKTKAEILNEHLQKERIIHAEGWDGKVQQLILNQ